MLLAKARTSWRDQLLGIVGLVAVSGGSAVAVIAYDRHAERAGLAEAALQHTPERASAQQAIALMRSSLLALHHANLTDDYSTMHQLTAPQFQAMNSADRLRQIFEEPRRRRLDLSVAAYSQPQWLEPPGIGADGQLRLKGVFQLPDGGLYFDLGYVPLDGQWRLIAISVSVQPNQV